jgi:hypothetical protein
MADQPSLTQQNNDIKRFRDEGADARDMVRKARELIEASRDAMRESDARIKRTRARGRWKPERLRSGI